MISIHALREEGDFFSSLLSLGDVISIHALREEGDRVQQRALHDRSISIHALREEGDPFTKHYFRQQMQFLSTPSARRATT